MARSRARPLPTADLDVHPRGCSRRPADPRARRWVPDDDGPSGDARASGAPGAGRLRDGLATAVRRGTQPRRAGRPDVDDRGRPRLLTTTANAPLGPQEPFVAAGVPSSPRSQGGTVSRVDPPFRADHVGSLLRAPEVLDARAQLATGAIAPAELRAVEDAVIARNVGALEGLGMRSITDGEQRRAWFHLDFLQELEGVAVTGSIASSSDSAATVHMTPPK